MIIEDLPKALIKNGVPHCPREHPRTPLSITNDDGEEGVGKCPESGYLFSFKRTLKKNKLQIVNGEVVEVENHEV